MAQETINQRLKFLVESLAQSSRAFSEMIGESPTNTHNYTSKRNTEPRASYLTKVLSHFGNINPAWLMTGEGEPFKDGPAPIQNQPNISGKKNQAVTGGHGKTLQNDHHLADCEKERDGLRAERDSLVKQVELLHGQLNTKDALIAAKEETIGLLKTAFNRPN